MRCLADKSAGPDASEMKRELKREEIPMNQISILLTRHLPLVTSYTYRGEDNETHAEVVCWRLPAASSSGISRSRGPGSK